MDWLQQVRETLGYKGTPEWLEGVQWCFRVIAGLAMFAGHSRYAYAVITTDYDERPGDRPHRGTWTAWFLVDLTIFLYMFSRGTQTWMSGVDAVINGFIFLIALFVGVNVWKHSERVCVVIALIGVALYLTFNLSGITLNLGSFTLDHAEIALLCACCATTYAVWPTWRKARVFPQGEDAAAWGWWTISCAAGVLGIPAWNVMNAAQPLAFTIVCGSMFVLLYFINPIRPLTKERWAKYYGDVELSNDEIAALEAADAERTAAA